MPQYKVVPTHRVEAWSVRPLPYEPKKGWQGAVEFHAELSAAVSKLHCDPRQVLHALYVAKQRNKEHCDAENILFYNLPQGTFTALADSGLRFERGFQNANVSCRSTIL